MPQNFGIINELLTSQGMNAGQLEIDMDSRMHLLQPNYASIYSFLMAMGQKSQANSQEFEWAEDEFIPFITKVDNVADNYDNTTVNVVVADRTILNKNDRLLVEDTGEIVIVTEPNHSSANTITVVRGYGTDNMVSIPHNSNLINLHNANALGSDTVRAKMTKPAIVSNYVQIFKSTSKIDKSTARHALRIGDTSERARQINKRGMEHVVGIERAFLFGVKHKDTSTLTPATFNTGGIFSFIKSNVTIDDNGTLTQTEFVNWLEDKVFAYGSNEKMIFVGNIISQALTKWYEAKLQLDPDFRQLGINVFRYVTPSGKIAYIKHHELFNISPAMKGTALALDMEMLDVKIFRPTVLNMNVQAPSLDAYLDEWLSEKGIKVAQERRHAVLKGVTAFS
jgi:hypothetical protein